MTRRRVIQRMIVASLVSGAMIFVFALTGRPREVKGRDAHAAPAGAGQGLNEGRQVFESRCAGCHGLDGRGGERAPSIATDSRAQRRSDAELLRIVHDGVPAAGMPAFSTLDSDTAKSLIGYLRLLQGQAGAVKLPGEARNGRAIFFGKGQCSQCHMVSGEGGFISSELTTVARTRSAEEIRQAILKPGNTGRQGGVVVVTTREGQKYSGVVRNQDNFSLQLQSLDGAFHLFLKPESETLERQAEPLMPSDYGARLSSGELNDVISFLIVSANESKAESSAKKQFQEDEENE
jgi:cytochrome c oxidase cbb3-type subunit 3